MTYRQAYDKIIEAYFKDEIEPMDGKFCFCGTLCGNTEHWMSSIVNSDYSVKELINMEDALLTPFSPKYVLKEYLEEHEVETPGCWAGGIEEDDSDYEEILFSGMSAALDVLRQIHIDRGEVIDEPIAFTQRKLDKV